MSIIENLFSGFIDIVLNILGTAVAVIVDPCLNFVHQFVPDLNSYLVTFGNFYIRVLKGVAFAKEVFLNCTGFPRPLFYIIIVFFFVKLTAMAGIRLRRFVFNIYYLIRGARGVRSTFN